MKTTEPFRRRSTHTAARGCPPDGGLRMRGVSVGFTMYTGLWGRTVSTAVKDADLDVPPGHLHAVIGGSGSGKSVLAHALMGILPDNAKVTGSLTYDGHVIDPHHPGPVQYSGMALIPQSVTYLDPLQKAGNHLAPVAPTRTGRLRIAGRYNLDPGSVDRYPFQLSGGMARRYLVAGALESSARVIIADEPTPGLSEDLAAEILGYLRAAADEGRAVLLISHDVDQACSVADEVSVLYHGRIVETVDPGDLLHRPDRLQHPFTRALCRAMPRNDFTGTRELVIDADEGGSVSGSTCPGVSSAGAVGSVRISMPPAVPHEAAPDLRALPVLRARGITVDRGGRRILDRVDLDIYPGERVGLIGPSGCGKTTLGSVLAGRLVPTAGTVTLSGDAVPSTGRNPVQMVTQHPELAVDPLWRMGRTLREPGEPDSGILDALGIERDWLTRYPTELSGGQVQRICIARVLSPDTRFIIADEISAMLDMNTQALIWEALTEVTSVRGTGMLVVTHDRALARRVCTRTVDFAELVPAAAR